MANFRRFQYFRYRLFLFPFFRFLFFIFFFTFFVTFFLHGALRVRRLPSNTFPKKVRNRGNVPFSERKFQRNFEREKKNAFLEGVSNFNSDEFANEAFFPLNNSLKLTVESTKSMTKSTKMTMKSTINSKDEEIDNYGMGVTCDGLRNCAKNVKNGKEKAQIYRNRSKKNKCWSRSERPFLHCSKNSIGNPSNNLLLRLREYDQYHHNCIQSIKNWSSYFTEYIPYDSSPFSKNPKSQFWDLQRRWEARRREEDRNTDKTPIFTQNCKYIVWFEPSAGLGNRLSSLVGAFLYALLTNRVLLVRGKPTYLPRLLCEPFLESSWFLPDDVADHIIRELKDSPRVGDLLARGEEKGKSQRLQVSKKGYVYLMYDYRDEDGNFFCEKGQKAVSDLVWLGFLADEYVGPSFYFLKPFRQELDRLFPDRVIFTHLSRHLLNPSNFMWERITRVHGAISRSVSKVVGLQIRMFNSYENITDRIHDCLVNKTRVLPSVKEAETYFFGRENEDYNGKKKEKENEKERGKENGKENDDEVLGDVVRQTTSVFLTSLQAIHYSYFRSLYTNGITSDGSTVSFYSESHEEHEDFGTWGWNQTKLAMTEIWVLSFCDVLFTTYTSSFGYLAAGLAGVRPYILNIANRFGPGYWRYNNRPVCELGRGTEPCFHAPPVLGNCFEHNGTDIGDVVPHVKRCVDFPRGVQLLSNIYTSELDKET